MSSGPFPLPIVYNSCPISDTYFDPTTPLAGGVWDSSKWTAFLDVTFLSDGIQVNGVPGFQAPNSGATITFLSGFDAIGTFVYGRTSFSYTKNSNPDMNLGLFSMGGGGYSPAYVVNVSQFNTHVQLHANGPYDGSVVLQGSYFIPNSSGPYIMEFTYEVTAFNTAVMTYWLWDATMTILLETNSVTVTGIQSAISAGFRQGDAYASSKLLDFWIYGPSLSLPGTCVGKPIPTPSTIIPVVLPF